MKSLHSFTHPQTHYLFANDIYGSVETQALFLFRICWTCVLFVGVVPLFITCIMNVIEMCIMN